MRCDKNCLECKLPKCKYDICDEQKNEHRIIREKRKVEEKKKSSKRKYEIPEKYKEIGKEYEKVRHTQYYQEHRQEILDKVREYNLKNRNSETCHKYYMAHKDEINKRNRERYVKNREKRLAESKAYYYAHRDEIRARRKARYRALKAESER